jgi:hypothetical protein
MREAFEHFRLTYPLIIAHEVAEELRLQGASPALHPIEGASHYVVSIGAGSLRMYARRGRQLVPAETVRNYARSYINQQLSSFRSILEMGR